MAFNPAEVAELQVNDVVSYDWKSVWIQHRWSDGWPLFRFTSAELVDMPTIWTALQFKPGDTCTITLGGQLAITGIILTRQTAYDAHNHEVELSGAGRTWAASTSSVDAKKANFDMMPLKPIADEVYGRFGVPVVAIGSIDATPFTKCQANPGELLFDFIDRLARQRGCTLGSDHLGSMLLIGDHSYTPVQQLIEGENIEKMQCVISNEMMASVYSSIGQAANAEQLNAMTAALMEAEVTSPNYKGPTKFIQVPLEHPAMSPGEVKSRAFYEARFRDGTLIRANVTVQGWLRDGVNLWRCGDDVWVTSPMAMLNFIMKIQTVTFQQDDQSGTTTELELVMPWMLADKPYGGFDNPAGLDPVPSDVTQTQPM